MIKLLGTQSNPILVSKSKHPFIIFNISSSSASRYNTITDMTTTARPQPEIIACLIPR